MRFVIGYLLIFIFYSCQKGPIKLNSHFDQNMVPPAVDYSKSEAWAALPNKLDFADSLPRIQNIKDGQSMANVDVFFIHPTIYTYKPKNNFEWNADVNDVFLNKKTDETTILNQATIFNGASRVYAPRYRQAHYYSFITDNKDDSQQALNLAYADVKSAFEYYLKNENNGKPMIIASHSQGTVHAKRLLSDFFDGKPLKDKLVMAYLVGIVVKPEIFKNIKPCQNAEETGCYASWNTFSNGFYPKKFKEDYENSISTNPITWTINEDFANYSQNLGGIGQKFKFYPNITDAQNKNGILWVNKPKVPGASLVKNKVWHIADYNFFWLNVRENVSVRINKYWAQISKNESK